MNHDTDARRRDTDDGLVTSAPPRSEIGDLLSDLLGEARKEAVRETVALSEKMSVREQERIEAAVREEDRRREEAQARLVEETRRRNEALERKAREEGEARAREEAARTLEEQARMAAESVEEPAQLAPIAAPLAAEPQGRGRRLLPLLAAAMLLSAGGIGAYLYASQPGPGFRLPGVRTEVKLAVAHVRGAREKAAARALAEKDERRRALVARTEQEAKRAEHLERLVEQGVTAAPEEAKRTPRTGGRRFDRRIKIPEDVFGGGK